MLKGFESHTEPLTNYEINEILPRMIGGLSRRLGIEQAISNRQIIEILRNKGLSTTDARIRKIINYIRVNDLVPGLIAASKGYYVSKNPKEIRGYIQTLAGREQAIRAIRVKTEKYLDSISTLF